MAGDTYYRPDRAWFHHAGYSHHVERTCAGIVQLLRDGGMSAGAQVLDVGCGSGLLASELPPRVLQCMASMPRQRWSS